MCDDLRQLGFDERKTKSLAIPNIPQKYLADFIRGYFDGDGNVWVGYLNKKRRTPTYVITTEFTSCSRKFISTLQKTLEKFDIIGGSLICKKGCFKLKYSINNSKALYELMYYGKGKSGLFLPRKKVVFDNYLRRINKKRL